MSAEIGMSTVDWIVVLTCSVTQLQRASSTETGSVYFADESNECALLVLLYNFERMRSIRLAEQVLDIFKNNKDVQQFAESVLPGVTIRLQQNPSEAFDALQSTEVLLHIQRSIDGEIADEVENQMKNMVARYCDDASREMLRLFAISPEWQSKVWLLLLLAFLFLFNAMYMDSLKVLFVEI
jgi:hypothetical protein